jgi:hypothetical protein
MKRILLIIILLIAILGCYAQEHASCNKWDWLLGQWNGEGSGQPGSGGGTFSFTFNLNKNIIIRKSHSEYPASANKPAVNHDDLMIVYLNTNGCPTKAIYFDNEGHTINYSVNYYDKSIVFLSDSTPGVPLFRLTYTLLDNGIVNTKFEMSPDGVKFMTYIEGKSKKTE